jgi:Holliday junction resolvase RusA-like endonuclease
MLPLPVPVAVVELVVDVCGVPVGQGSKVIVGGRPRGDGKPVAPPRLIDANAHVLRRWRDAVTAAAAARMVLGRWLQSDDLAFEVEIVFWFPRPKSVRRPVMCVKPDVDKCARAVLDSLTDAGVWPGDSRVVRLVAEKRYALSSPSARVTVRALPTRAVGSER